MNTKKILLLIVAVSFVFSLFQLINTLRSRILSVDDTQITSLIQKNLYTDNLLSKKLLSNQIITLEYKARYDNLGIVAIRFDRPEEFSDTLYFRLKEKNASSWYYEQAYQAHTFDVKEYFTFGFPTIPQSKNRQYIVELESLKGKENFSLSFNQASDFFLTKYSFPKEYLIQHKDQIIPFIVERIWQYLNHIVKTDLISFVTLFVSIILFPLIAFKLLVILWKIMLYLEKNRKFNQFSTYALPIILFFSTIGIFGYISTIGVDVHHDGILFKPAMDVASGQMLFRDTFTMYGAFTTLLQTWAIIIFGKYLITIKFLTVFFYGLIGLLLYFLYRKILPKLLVAITILVFFILPICFQFFLPWSSVYALFFQLLTAYAVVKFFETKKEIFIILTGMTTSLTFWCRQPVGIFLFLIIISLYIYFYILKVNTLNETKRHIVTFIIGNFIISSFFLSWIIFNNAFRDWSLQSIVYALSWGNEFGDEYNLIFIIKSLFPISFSPISIWTLIPLSTIFLFIKYSFRLISKKNIAQSKFVLSLCFIGLASWLQYYPPGGLLHVYWGAIPMLGLYTFFIYQLIDEHLIQWAKLSKHVLKYITIIIIVCMSLPDISYWITEGINKIQQPYYFLELPSVLKGLRLTKEEVIFYTYMNEHIQMYFKKNSSGNVITVSNDALYLTFDQRIKNFQPSYIRHPSISNSIYPQFDPIKDKYIKETKPFLISYNNFLPEGYCKVDSHVWEHSMFLATPCEFLTAE